MPKTTTTTKYNLTDDSGLKVIDADTNVNSSNIRDQVLNTGQSSIATTGGFGSTTKDAEETNQTTEAGTGEAEVTGENGGYTEETPGGNQYKAANTTIKDKLGNTSQNTAKSYSDKYYQQLQEEAKSTYSTRAAELATVAQEQQLSSEMQSYTNAQTREKLGWTGGYVLDQDRQLEVLRSGIQAQLFNQQELNRLGLESQLAAARLNADLKNTELAAEYYFQAENLAINVANSTGYYLSAEARDLLEQQSAAEQIMEMYGENSAEYVKAQQVSTYVDQWFAERDLSKAGQKTAQLIMAEAQLETEKWTQKLSLISAMYNSDDYKTGSIGIIRDASDNVMFSTDGTSVQTVTFSSITNAELKEYLATGTNDHLVEQAADYKLASIAQLFNEYLTNNNAIATEENWKIFIENSEGKPLIDSYKKLFNGVDEALLENSSYTTSADDTNAFTIGSDLSLKTYLSLEAQKNISAIENNTDLSDDEKKDKIDEIIAKENSDTQTSISSYDGNYFRKQEGYSLSQLINNYQSGEGAAKISFALNNQVRIEDPMAFSLQIKRKDHLDIDIATEGKNGKNYDIVVNWVAAVNKDGTLNDLGKKLQELTNGVTPKNGEIFVYNNKLYIYNKGPQWEKGYFGEVNPRMGGAEKLYSDIMDKYVDGIIPDRWN